jgi:hypothetical protein
LDNKKCYYLTSSYTTVSSILEIPSEIGDSSLKKNRKLLVKLGKKMREVDDLVFVNWVLKRKREEKNRFLITHDGRFKPEIDKLLLENLLIVGVMVNQEIRLNRIKTLYPEADDEDINNMSENILLDEEYKNKCHIIITNNYIEQITSNVDLILKSL